MAKTKSGEELKIITVRLKIDEWKFLRNKSTELQKSINWLIKKYVEKDKKKMEKRLTENEVMT